MQELHVLIPAMRRLMLDLQMLLSLTMPRNAHLFPSFSRTDQHVLPTPLSVDIIGILVMELLRLLLIQRMRMLQEEPIQLR